ncbi:hypothetical protein Lal_00038561 [Lupinus albus]|nr:hypothetical protein Lal_00038561 [Lupinus albus]
MNKPDQVWEETWQWLSDGILYNQRNISNNQGTVKCHVVKKLWKLKEFVEKKVWIYRSSQRVAEAQVCLSPEREASTQAIVPRSKTKLSVREKHEGEGEKSSDLLSEDDIPFLSIYVITLVIVFSFMLLRGKVTEDQLQFNPEIERSGKSNRKKEKNKKK